MRKNNNVIVAVILIIMAMMFAVVATIILQSITIKRIGDTDDSLDRENHIVVLGTYENENFLRQVWSGAQEVADDYNSLVEFYVSDSWAEDVSLQSMFNYAAFVNANGIIAFISSPAEMIHDIVDINGAEIPIVTTGTFAPNVQQISYIGTSYWELGQVFGEEINMKLGGKGTAVLISSESSSNPNFSNLTNSIQSSLFRHSKIVFSIVDQYSENYVTSAIEQDNNVLFVCLTEEDTLTFAQFATEYNLTHATSLSVIGFGSNENCQFYLSKGILDELICLNPEKIGEAALKEIFEYRTNGHANSYMAADIKIMKMEL